MFCHLRAAQTLRSDLQLGAVYIRMMQESTEDITAPWLLPEMVSRVADMLNYFLDHLAGSIIDFESSQCHSCGFVSRLVPLPLLPFVL